VIIGDPCRSVTRDLVVARATLEFIEKPEAVGRNRAAGIRTVGPEADRVINVIVIAAGYKFDRAQCILAYSGWIHANIGDRTGSQFNVDRSCRVGISGAVITELAVERVVATIPGEQVIDVA
jgi:hypothetical protein